MEFVEPKVFLIAESKVDHDQLKEMLIAVGGDTALQWLAKTKEASKSEGELLTEVSGRMCYKSFGIGLNPNVTKIRQNSQDYIDNTLAKGDGSIFEHASCTFAFIDVSRVTTHELVRHRVGTAMCLTGDTLIHSVRTLHGRPDGTKKRKLEDLYQMNLTPHGRSRIPLLKLRVLDEHSNTFTSGKVHRILNSGIKDVFEIELEDGSKCKMTRDHTILTSKGWMRLEDLVQFIDVNANRVAFYGTPLATVATNGYTIPYTALQLEDGIYAYRSKWWLEAKIRDGLTFREIGAIAGVSLHTVRVWVQKRGLTGLSKSLKLYARAGNKGLHYTLGPMNEKRRGEISLRMRGEKNHRWRGGITPHPMNPELRGLILKRDRYHCRMCSKSPTRYMLSIHHIDIYEPGKASNTDPNNLITLCKRCHGRVTGFETMYEPYLYRLLNVPIQFPTKNSPRTKLHKPKFLTLVRLKYCGKQQTYDIMMKEPYHNFIANHIIVHNSQESLRYVRPTSLKFWLPPDLEGKSKEIKSIVEDIEKDYRRLESSFEWEKINFDVKKRITSALRRILPDGMSTSIIWTANHRTIRHVITMRTAESAEVEIRLVFDKVARIMKEKFPLIYRDFEYVELDDKTRSWRPKYVKA